MRFIFPLFDFSGTPRAGNDPLAVDFTDHSIPNPSSWIWRFKRNEDVLWTQFDTVQNPQKIFTDVGVYDIQMEANGNPANTKTKESYVVVTENCSPNVGFEIGKTSGIKASSETVKGLNRVRVSYLNTSNSGAVEYKWSKRKTGSGDDFVVFSTDENPTHIFDIFDP